MRDYLCSMYGANPVVVSGPCSAESEGQVLETAHALSALGVKVFRAGLWKPRTHPGGFEGVGTVGLPWLQRVKRETGMLIATEVATPQHVELALEGGIDIFWIGARTTANPFAVQQIADALHGHDVPVLIKNPMSPDVELWIGAMQRLQESGITRIGAVHRGFTPTTEQDLYRNTPHWDIAIELKRRYPTLCILCDPSHIAGKRELVGTLSRQAISMGFDGLFIEAHCSPEKALSDARQQLMPSELSCLMTQLHPRHGDAVGAELEQLRQRIDECDRELVNLLARRMAVVREIGQYKQAHQVPVVQASRFDAVLRRAIELARSEGMSEAFITAVMHAIHEEAVRQQI